MSFGLEAASNTGPVGIDHACYLVEFIMIVVNKHLLLPFVASAMER